MVFTARVEPIEDISASVKGRKVLFAASTGGHLAQLRRYSHSFEASPDSLWITFDSAQSRTLLAGSRVTYTRYVAPRDWRAVAQLSRDVRALLKDESFDMVISTGAAMSVGVLAAAKRAGIQTVYIESVSRLLGPSLSGRIIAAARLADTYTQHARWASKRWRLHRSILVGFEVSRERHEPALEGSPKLFVTLGTIRPYRFDAAINAILEVGWANGDTVWQTGVTSRDDLPGTAYAEMSSEAFERAARAADVVVTHAGVGTILQLLEWGISPVVIPRERTRGEHVDDHQLQIAELLRMEALASVVSPVELTPDILREALGKSVRARG